MKKIGLFLFMIFFILHLLQAQTYSLLWDKVEEMVKKDLPQSVVRKAMAIFEKAQAEKNVPQMMKAYLTMMTYRGEISPDSIVADRKLLEKWANDERTSLPDRAVLYSILGGMTIREDFNKGNDFLLLSLKDSLVLVKYPAEKLIPIVKSGEVSRLYFDDNLYDLLARRAIDCWRNNQWNSERENVLERIRITYQTLLNLYQKEAKRSAWILTALDAYPEADEEQLWTWIKEYGDLSVCAEVYIRLSQIIKGEDRLTERLALVREAIKRYPRYKRINVLKNVEEDILSPLMNMTIFSAYPDMPIQAKVCFRNLEGLTVQIYRLNLLSGAKELKMFNEKEAKKYGTWYREEHISLQPAVDYKTTELQIEFSPLPQGVYYFSVSEKHFSKKSGVVVVVAPTMEIYRSLPDNMRETIVLDKRNGVPKGEAVVSPEEETWQRYHYSDNDKEQIHVNLFTDRAIYRPGQTVYFSGLVYKQYRDSLKVMEAQKLQVNLWNSEDKEIDGQEVESDVFGKFSGMFVLPESGQTGVYRVGVGRLVQSFRVEEYKRPGFKVSFDEVKATYKTGDTLSVDGIAVTLAGTPIQTARVKYTVMRMENTRWRRKGPITHKVEGETVTDTNGCFRIPVHFLPVEKGNSPYWCHSYEVLAEVVSRTGETQSERLVLPLSSSSLMASVEPWKEILVKEQPEPFTFVVCNLKGQPVETKVYCEITQKNKVVRDFVVESNKTVTIDELFQLPSGQYILTVRVVDKNGMEYKRDFSFSLFSLEDTRIPYEASEWDYQMNCTFPSTIFYGSSEHEVTLFYDVFSGNKHIESKRIVFSDSLLHFPFEYKEEYGDGILVSMAFVKNNQLYAKTYTIRKPEPEIKLNLKWVSFRDKLQPGEHETWTLSVCYPDGTPAEAQLLASMYDASLDAFVPHSWNLNIGFNRSIPFTYWRVKENTNSRLNLYYSPNYWETYPLEYSVLDVPVVSRRWENEMMLSRRVMAKAGGMNDVVDAVTEARSAFYIGNEESITDTDLKDKWFRRNFAETAFFYPCLRTDAEGKVKIEFSLPESLTTWKFMGLAHTKDMGYGRITSESVVSKEFMLQSNMPRFVRIGDKVSLSATLANLSDDDVVGDVRMELFNPKDDKIYLVKKQRFLVTPKATMEVHFGFVVDEEYSDLAVRWIAEGDWFSDGEQRILPVLGNNQRITESVPFYLNAKGTSIYSLESLFNHHSKSVKNPRMTVEFSGTPGWYAVQALASLQNPENENAISWMAACYAYAITRYLAETNQEIAQSFDRDSLDVQLQKCFHQLQDLQNNDGSWSWYKGMMGNRYITTRIVELLVRLKLLTGTMPNKMNAMYINALNYLDKEAEKEYQTMKRRERKGDNNLVPSGQILHYLYICALNNSLDVEKEMIGYFIHLFMQPDYIRALTIYEKACTAMVLQVAGEIVQAKDMLRSLMEYAVYSDEMGRYFDTHRADYSWLSYKIPTQVAVIEAVNSIANDGKTVEELKRWLLQQKRVQDWDTPIATADAVYALLNVGKNVLIDTGKATLTIGKHVIRVPQDEALSYVRQEIDGDVMGIKDMKVKKYTEGVSWGAVYAEFEEKMDRIGIQGGVLGVCKEIYKDGKLLQEGESLKIGDRLTVRLKVKSERDMDFIEVKDERAACFEPVDVLSGYRWMKGMGYYQRTKDSSTSFYIDQFRKGTYFFEYDVYVNLNGCYQGGAAVVRSVYAPEFNGHESGGKVTVE